MPGKCQDLTIFWTLVEVLIEKSRAIFMCCLVEEPPLPVEYHLQIKEVATVAHREVVE